MKRLLVISPSILILLLVYVQDSISIPKKSSDPALKDLFVTTSDNHLLLFGVLQNGFTDAMIQGLHSGLPIHFSFFVELTPENGVKKDEKLASFSTSHIISFDTLKETYKVEIEESGKRFFSFSSLNEAQKAANELNGLKVIELSELKHGASYTLKVKAELYKKTLPMGLHEVVPFVSWWDIKTKWHTISFTL